MSNLLKVNSRDCVSLLTFCNMPNTFANCDVFILIISFLISSLSILNRFDTLNYFFLLSTLMMMMMMMMMMMLMNCFCGMVDRRKTFSLISSLDHYQRSSPSRISDTPWAGFEPAQNLSSGLVEWSCAVVITTKPPRMG